MIIKFYILCLNSFDSVVRILIGLFCMVTSVKAVIDLDDCHAYGELACCFLLFPLQIGLLCMCVVQRCKKITSSGEVRY